MMFMPPGMQQGMPQGMPFGQNMPFGMSQAQQPTQMPQQQQNNPMIQALMQQGQGQTAPIGQIGMPNMTPPFGTPPWMRPMGK